jgi:hypothetical protein
MLEHLFQVALVVLAVALEKILNWLLQRRSKGDRNGIALDKDEVSC